MSFFSAGVEYGIHCLTFLVDEQGGSREASVRDLAELQGVPQEYLAKVFTKLARARLLEATEGVRGGFRLARPASEITLLDVAQAIDGVKELFQCREVRQRCVLFDGAAPLWAVSGSCSIHQVMQQAQARMEGFLREYTILDMSRRIEDKAPAAFGSEVDHWLEQKRTGRNGSLIASSTDTD